MRLLPVVLALAACSTAPLPTRIPAPARTPAPAPPPATHPRAPAPLAQAPPSAPGLDLSRFRRTTAWTGEDLPGDERSRRAIAARSPVVAALFAQAGVPFPPAELLFRAFKRDRELEVWASASRGAPMAHVATYQVCAASGDLGPKRREGDRQVPEGFYKVHYLWPNSAYHLEIKIGYPNDLDRALSQQIHADPGGEIMIHGNCASIGCLAMTDERVEELWTMASAFQVGERRVHVHIFPARDLPALLREPELSVHHRFWENLREGSLRFEGDHRLFDTWADWHARYYFR